MTIVPFTGKHMNDLTPMERGFEKLDRAYKRQEMRREGKPIRSEVVSLFSRQQLIDFEEEDIPLL